jgi:TPR repeat protein
MSPALVTLALQLLAAATAADPQATAEDLFRRGVALAESPEQAAESTRCFRKAAELGHARAQYALGAAYTAGRGIRKDPVEAYAWIRLSAKPGADERTESALSGLARSLTPDQLAKANRLASRRKQEIEKRRRQDVRKR